MATQDKAATAPKPKAATAPKLGQSQTYTAPHEVYQGGILYAPGKHFTTSEPKGREWEKVGAGKEKLAGALKQGVADEANLDDLDIPALKSFAAEQGIDLGDAESEPEMVEKIKAAQDK